jgi:DNA-binding transcriptional ArsR family regulator
MTNILRFMKTSSSALLPVLRSDAVGQLLARLFVHPRRAWVLKDLAAAASVSLPTATREVSRMVNAGLVAEERVGRTRQVSANTASRLFEPLQRLMLLTYGPVSVLEDELSDVAGIEGAFIYGSWAARHEGVEGSEPNDIDVLAVGDPDPDEVYDAAERAQLRLGRPVSIRRVSGASWHGESEDPFLRNVRSSPMVALDLDGE